MSRHTEVLDAPRGIQNYVKKQWEKAQSNDDFVVVSVKQIKPGEDVQEDFEQRRTELDQIMRNFIATNNTVDQLTKLTTLQLWTSLSEGMLAQVLEHGFAGALKGSKQAFCEDPVLAIKEGHPESPHLLLCRVALGREGPEYKMSRGKYILQNTRSVLPAFLVTYAREGMEEEVAAADEGFNQKVAVAFAPENAPRT